MKLYNGTIEVNIGTMKLIIGPWTIKLNIQATELNTGTVKQNIGTSV